MFISYIIVYIAGKHRYRSTSASLLSSQRSFLKREKAHDVRVGIEPGPMRQRVFMGMCPHQWHEAPHLDFGALIFKLI